MTALAGPPPPGFALPPIFDDLAAGSEVTPVWLNLGGDITAKIGSERYLKWSPRRALLPEVGRLQWAWQFHPVPRVLEYAPDGEWMLSAAIDGASAVTLEPRSAARALGAGLRALHEALPVDGCPFDWSAESRGATAKPPPVDRLVVCHGDACVPNTLVRDGKWVAHVDLGHLGLADRWADIATAAWSLNANFGDGLEGEFFSAYGARPDRERLDYYTALWNAPSA